MAVYIDDEAVELQGGDLGSLLSDARRHLSPSGRVVVEVELDGQRLDEQTLAMRQHSSIQDVQLRLTTADPTDLASSTLQQVRDELRSVEQTQTEAAELFQQDQLADAVQKLASVLKVWQQTHQAVVDSIGLMGIRVEAMTVDGEPAERVVATLVERLKFLRDMLAARDSVGLADVLMYEWPQTIAQWDQLIAALIDEVRR